MFPGFFNDSFFETPGNSFGRFFDEDSSDERNGMPYMGQLAPTDPNERTEMSHGRPLNEQGMMSPFGMMNPFGSFQNAMSGMGSFMDMSRNMQQQFMDPSQMMDMDTGNGFGYSSSKVQSYVNDGSGQPKTYQAEKSTHFAPGGVKQVQKSVRDSQKGDKMSLGRHLRDQAHVVTKSRHRGSDNIEQAVDYHGFAEEDEPRFNEDWRNMTRQFLPQRPQEQPHSLPHKHRQRNRLRDGCLKPNKLALDEA